MERAESKQLKSRVEEIKAVAKGAFSENDIFIIKKLTETIEQLNGQIRDVGSRIELIANPSDIEILSSVPGIGKRSAAAILAEIGDAKRFSNGTQIAFWTGLAPSLRQSAGICILGSITKQGSRWLRWNRLRLLMLLLGLGIQSLGFSLCVLRRRRVMRLLMLLLLGRC